jgi:hypothetical protein
VLEAAKSKGKLDMTRYRYSGRLGRRPVATIEQVVASESLGGPELIAQAHAANAARLEQGLYDLIDDLGISQDDPDRWFKLAYQLAKRHVPIMGPLKIPGLVGRAVSPEEEAAEADIEAAIQARSPGTSIPDVCENLARSELGTDASVDAVRQRAARMRKRYFYRRRRNRQ